MAGVPARGRVLMDMPKLGLGCRGRCLPAELKLKGAPSDLTVDGWTNKPQHTGRGRGCRWGGQTPAGPSRSVRGPFYPRGGNRSNTWGWLLAPCYGRHTGCDPTLWPGR